MDISLKVDYSPGASFHSLSDDLKKQVKDLQKKDDSQEYSDPSSFVNLPFDESLRHSVYALASEKKALSPDALIIVGIGGSNLGTYAVQEALFGSFYNQQHPEFPVYYADTVDANYYASMMRCISTTARPLVVIISKSGTTLESIANAQLMIDMLIEKAGRNFSEHVVIISDADSVLWKWGKKESFSCLAIPKVVGGRYSVLSAVGLFPLAMMGIDIDQLHAGARAMVEDMSSDEMHNPALRRACWLVAQRKAGYVVHDLFVFSKELNAIGAWYRQLMAESLGKNDDAGIIPTTSVGTIDLHSVAQLALGGPPIIATTFLEITHSSPVYFKNHDVFDELTPRIRAAGMQELLQAALRGTQKAYTHSSMPFSSLVLASLNAYTCGALLQLCMNEIMYAGYILEINPFDQPEVELYKREMRKILAHE